MIRSGAQRAVDLLQGSSNAFLANGFVRQFNCVSCHQQTLPAVAFALARERGLRVDERELGRQLGAQVAQRSATAEFALELDEPTPAATVTLGYEADGLHALRYAPDAVTESTSHYLLGVQRTDGSWFSYPRRPPIMDGTIITTAWSARAVQLYPPDGRAREADDSLRRARDWLGKQHPPIHNERVFQLLGLAWANETKERMRPFATALMEAQRSDGGWAQLPGLDCDAWATGTALIALNKAGVAPSHAAYQRGVDYLLRTQFDDGSWWVRSRSWPFQPHFDSRFPHGKDQWISAAGTAWATMALLLTLEPTVAPADLPNGQQMIASFVQSSRSDARQATARALASTPPLTATVDFARDIKPLLERSCVDCHSGDRAKGSFRVESRDALLKGGQSGDPAIVPGYADESPLIRNVSGAIEDLEMPPLNRRHKYPALTSEEIARLRTWIDAGALWPASLRPAQKGEPTSELPKKI
jgi:mono/diheme cytochrome c family protein